MDVNTKGHVRLLRRNGESPRRMGAMRSLAAIMVVSTALAVPVLCTSWRSDPQGSVLMVSEDTHIPTLAVTSPDTHALATLPRACRAALDAAHS